MSFTKVFAVVLLATTIGEYNCQLVPRLNGLLPVSLPNLGLDQTLSSSLLGSTPKQATGALENNALYQQLLRNYQLQALLSGNPATLQSLYPRLPSVSQPQLPHLPTITPVTSLLTDPIGNADSAVNKVAGSVAGK